MESIYSVLLGSYGHQGWWPIYSRRGTPGYDEEGYLKKIPGKYSRTGPLTSSDKFEISLGAVLTQNTSWKNVRLALSSLYDKGFLDPWKIYGITVEKLAELIKPSGYYNQKAKKLKILTEFLIRGEYLEDGDPPSREGLLKLWGIGKETADSILLYAFGVPVFVVDAYTKRMFKRIGILEEDEEYDEIADIFTSALAEDSGMFNEYHALIVRHSKEHCRKNPVCRGCVLKMKGICSFDDPAEGESGRYD